MSRGWRSIRRLASAAASALLLSGCAVSTVDVSSPPGPPSVATRAGRPGFVVAAPAASDALPTATMAGEIARRTGFGLVVASASEPARGDSAWEQRVLEAAQGPLRFYAEIHGGDGHACAGRLDIVAVGMDREQAGRLRALAELIRDAHLRASRDVPRLDVHVEPAASRAGVLRLPRRGLQLELPGCGRREWRETYTAILADFIAQAAAIPD